MNGSFTLWSSCWNYFQFYLKSIQRSVCYEWMLNFLHKKHTIFWMKPRNCQSPIKIFCATRVSKSHNFGKKCQKWLFELGILVNSGPSNYITLYQNDIYWIFAPNFLQYLFFVYACNKNQDFSWKIVKILYLKCMILC